MFLVFYRKPETDEELVEYFLNTVADDLEYEVARYRPRLTAAFFRCAPGFLPSCLSWLVFSWL